MIISRSKLINYVYVLLAGMITAYAFINTIHFLAWICMLPLFIATRNAKTAYTFRLSIVYTITIAIFIFLWMPTASHKFAGTSLYGLVCLILSVVLFSLYYATALTFHSFLKTNSIVIKGLFMASVMVLAEFIFNYIFKNIPFFAFRVGHILAENLYSIQYVSVLGVGILTFVTVWFNHLLAHVLANSKRLAVCIPIALILIFYTGGYFIYSSFLKNNSAVHKIDVVAIRPNFSPEVKWNEQSGNMLIEELLSLLKKAVAEKPQLIVWTESVVPWTYHPQDDFVKEIVRISKPSGASNFLGMATAMANKNNLYNSVYGISPDGSIAGRYDKQQLINLIEKPFFGLIIPFAYSDSFYMEAGSNEKPIGKAGILLCNEISIPSLALKNVNRGAKFLVNMGNDGWFANTYLVEQHFISARLRAVENRRDMIMNNEGGISGLVQASGNVAIKEKENSMGAVIKMQVIPREQTSFYTENPYLLLLLCAGIIVINLIKSTFKSKKTINMRKLLLILLFAGLGLPVFAAGYFQSNWRWRNDDGTESTATFKAAENTQITIDNTNTIRLRVEIYRYEMPQYSLYATPAVPTLYYYSETDLTPVEITTDPGTSNAFYLATSAHDVSESTTDQLTNNYSYPHVAGKVYEQQATELLEFPDRNNVELEWVLKPTIHLVPEETYSFIIGNYEVDSDNLQGLRPSLKVAASVLPVNLVSYTTKVVPNGVNLQWSVASETQNSHFTIAHGTDGKKFTDLGTENSKGTGRATYSFKHYTPSVGTNYYRLSQTDFDGKTKILGTEAVNFTLNQSLLSVTPNPADKDMIIINIPTVEKDFYSVRILDISGKKQFDGNIVPQGKQLIIRPSQSLSSGIYIVDIENLGVQKFLVK